MKHFVILILLTLGHVNLSNAQSKESFQTIADSLYMAENYIQAGYYYIKSAESTPFRGEKKYSYYNAACCYSLLNDNNKAFNYLDLSIKYGYNDKEHLLEDKDLSSLKTDLRWNKIIKKLKPAYHKNPGKIEIVSTDIKNFYKAFDLVDKEPSKASEIFEKNYFLKGTVGLDDFYHLKIRNTNSFISEVIPNQAYFASIRSTLSNNDQHKQKIKSSFIKFKEIYPEAVFPNIYFVVGRFSSNGTASSNGIMIGTEIMSKTPSTNTTTWSPYLKEWIMNYDQIPSTVAHELIHFNQKGMKKENTLLRYSMVEGSAEFIGELISGHTDGDYKEFSGREKSIWQDFKTDMLLDKYEEWLNPQEPKRPRGGMYWAGYIISKAYYERAIDKNQAIWDILNIKDYLAFYNKSQVENYIEKNF